MNNKDVLVESLINKMSKLDESYYTVMATNRGMWGGLTTPLRIDGKIMLFKNKDVALKYIDNNKQGNVNNFNSYSVSEANDLSEEYVQKHIDNYFIINTLDDIANKQQSMKSAREEKELKLSNERDRVYDILLNKIDTNREGIRLEKSMYDTIMVYITAIGKNYGYAHRKFWISLKEDKFIYNYEDRIMDYKSENLDEAVEKFCNKVEKLYKEMVDKYGKKESKITESEDNKADYWKTKLDNIGIEKTSIKVVPDFTVIKGYIPHQLNGSAGEVVLHMNSQGKITEVMILGGLDINKQNEKVLRDFIFDFGELV